MHNVFYKIVTSSINSDYSLHPNILKSEPAASSSVVCWYAGARDYVNGAAYSLTSGTG
jgi:hypothetical protein